MEINIDDLPIKQNIPLTQGDDIVWNMTFEGKDTTNYKPYFTVVPTEGGDYSTAVMKVIPADFELGTDGRCNFKKRASDISNVPLEAKTYYYTFQVTDDNAVRKTYYKGKLTLGWGITEPEV